MPNYFDIVKQSKTHIISYETKILLSHILPWQSLRHKEYPHFKKKYALCCTYFIKLCMNLCLFHNLNSGIGVEFQGTLRNLRISVIDSFQYNGIKTLTSSMSKRHQYFYGVIFRLLHTL